MEEVFFMLSLAIQCIILVIAMLCIWRYARQENKSFPMRLFYGLTVPYTILRIVDKCTWIINDCIVGHSNFDRVSASLAMSLYVMIFMSLILITLNFLAILYIILKSGDMQN